MYKQELKEAIRESLENSFIDDKSSVEKEIKLLNLFISTFAEDSKYAYDEYCMLRMKAELEACDSLDIDFEREVDVTPREEEIIEGRATSRFYDGHGEYEEILKEELIKWQVHKFFDLDRKVYFEICKHSSETLLKNKIPAEIYSKKESYFQDFCTKKAIHFADKVANGNKEQNEEEIRAQML